MAFGRWAGVQLTELCASFRPLVEGQLHLFSAPPESQLAGQDKVNSAQEKKQ